LRFTGIITLLVLAVLCSGAARAQLSSLADDQYRIDLFEGPILGSTRVVSLGGAFAGLAEQSVGIPFNPASVAHRTHYSDTRFDWDIALDWLSPGIFQSDKFDFDTNGRRSTTSMMAGLIGGHIQFGGFGVGVLLKGQAFRFRYNDEVAVPAKLWRFEGSLGTLQITGGYGLFAHQFIFGLGIKMGLLDIKERISSGYQFKAQSAAMDLGLLYRPKNLPFRLALVFVSPAKSNSDEDVPTSGATFYMPGKGVAIPWEVRIGGALRIGGPQFNSPPQIRSGLPAVPPAPGLPGLPAPVTGKEEPEPKKGKADEFFITISAEVVASGPVDDAIGLDGFIEQKMEQSGEEISWSARIGAEAEIIPGWARLRGGCYWEPSRFEDHSGRIHGTFGLEVRLIEISFLGDYVLKFSSAVDFAQNYSNVSLSIGFWH
jgi:hypothetical protein